MIPSSAAESDELLDALETLAQFGVPGHGAAKLVDVGSSPFLDFLRDEVLYEFVSMGGSTFRILEGPYGTGKTHLLQLIEDLALESGYAVARADLSQSIGFEAPRVLVKYLLQNLMIRTRDGDVRSLPSAIAALAVDPGLFGPHRGFVQAIRYMATATDAASSPPLRDFMSGERVTAVQLRRSGYSGVKNPLSDRNAEVVMRTVTAGLRACGATGTVLLFDETEPTLSRTVTVSRKVEAAANLMRRMIDQSAAGMLTATLTVFAVLPGFIESCARAYPALGQRLTTNRVPGAVPWRSPIVPVEEVSKSRTREEFLDAAVNRFEELGLRLGVSSGSMREDLFAEGRIALATNAGAGYRRDLVRRFATVVLSAA